MTPDLPPLREVIARHNLSARKSLGQNFLLDLNLTRRIARAAAPLAGHTIVEVGPGPGGLTRALLMEGAERVVAVERDARVLPALAEVAAAFPGRLEVVEADALGADWRVLVGENPAKIVANLPYNIATPLLDLSGPMPYTILQTAFDPFFPRGRLYYWKSTNVHELSDACIDAILAAAAARPSHLSDIPIWHLGGAMSRVPPDATGYGRRDAPYLVTGEATWTDPAQSDSNIAWARDLVDAMKPFSRGGLYLNFPGFGEEKVAMLRDAYGANYERLATLKSRYDPGNLFRMNLNIPPAGSAAAV